jgi:hypothetical protein
MYHEIVQFGSRLFFQGCKLCSSCVCWDRGIISVAGKVIVLSEMLNFKVLLVAPVWFSF